MTRTLLLRVSLVLLASNSAYGRANDLPYSLVSRVPRVVDSEALVNFEFDPVGRRMYAQSREGVYWIDVRAREPRVTGPILPKTIASIEMAADLGRLYFAREREQFGYLDLRTNQKTILAGPEWQGVRLTYEATRRELYTPTRSRGDTMSVYDAQTGARTAEIKLPGFQVGALKSAAGKVFFTVVNKPELYAIDAATHTVVPWRVNGRRIVTPHAVITDPLGRLLLVQMERDVIAIDVPTATVVARVKPPRDAGGMAFDPETRMLVVPTQEIPDHPRIRLYVYSLGDTGFTALGELPNVGNEGARLLPMHGGFIQEGHDSLLFWLAR